MNTTERKIAVSTQEKFEFYVISLVFTLLALSIQTADFGASSIADSAELLGWLALFISGLVGLWRMEYIPVLRTKGAEHSEFQQELHRFLDGKDAGKTEVYALNSQSLQPIDEMIGNRKGGHQDLYNLPPIHCIT